MKLIWGQRGDGWAMACLGRAPLRLFLIVETNRAPESQGVTFRYVLGKGRIFGMKVEIHG